MDNTDREDLCNSAPDEETVAREMKRKRRVSFAEITSVHVFDRDEECDSTPPDSKQSPDHTEPSSHPSEGFGFLRDFADSDDSKELSHNEEDDGDEEDDEHRGLFVRPIDSFSPGSGFGSATSNDEDNFFGPVSASFIRSGQLSDSAASDDNHDITLDSTAFSLHFRSLMQSTSEGNFRTPTRTDTHITFEGKTTTGNSTPSNSGSSMVLTGVDKPIPRSSLSGGKSSAGSGSNEMSLIGDNPHMYDYGRLSPSLDALLAESSKIMPDVSVSDQVNISESPNHLKENSGLENIDEQRSELMELKDSRDNDLENSDIQDHPTEVVSDANHKLFEGNAGSASSLINQTSYACSSSTSDTLPDADASSPGHQNLSLEEPTLGMSPSMDTDSAKDVIQVGGGSKLGFGGGSNHTLTPLSGKIQMDSDYGYLGHLGDGIKEESLIGARCTPVVGFKTNQAAGSPLDGSISSIGAKRRQIFDDTAVLSRSELLTTPFSGKPPRSSLKNIRDSANILSIGKKTSNLKIRESSPSGVGDKYSEPVFPNHLRNSPSFAAIEDEINKDPNKKPINVSVTNGGKNISIVPHENREEIATTEMRSYSVGTPRNIQTLRQKEEIVTTVQDGEHKDKIYAGMFCNDRHSELTAAAVLLPQFSTLGNDIQQHSFINHNIVEDALVIPKSDSLQKIRFQETGTPDILNSSLLKQLSQKLFVSPVKSCISEAPMQQEQSDKLVSSGVRLDSEDIANMSHLSSMAEVPMNHSFSLKGNIACDTLLKQNNELDASTFNGNASDSRNLEKSKLAGNSEFLRQNLPKESENIGDHETPLRYRATLRSPSGSPQMNSRTRTDPARLKEKIPEKTSSYDSASPYIHKRTTSPTRLEKRLLEWLPHPQGPSTKEPNVLSENGSMQPFVRNDPGSPTSIQYSNGEAHGGPCQDAHILQEPLYVQDVEHSGRKRRLEEIIIMDKNNNAEIVRIQKSPKVAPEHCAMKNIEAEEVGNHASPRHWAYIFSKFSGAMEQQLLPLADNLNLKEVCILEDMLGRVQKANKYKILCNELQSQKLHDHAGNLQQKRVAEARSLQLTLVYEHAKLQLLRLRHKRLLKKVQSLHSGIQESQFLKKSFPVLCIPRAIGVQYNESHLPSVSVDHNSKSKEAYDKVNAKRQELGALDKKVKDLTKSLLSSCKIKGEPSSADILVLVNDHLKKKTNCRFVRQDLQVWEVHDLESKNFHHSLVLNYCHFLHQRFTLNVGPVSSIVTINKLIDENMMKSFPNINACTAFAFVFNAESTRTIGGSKNLALETQVTSFLLTNLLDVVEEANMAHIELRNLIQTSFYSPCVGQLDLQFCFIDFKTGYKVTLTLDMTSLNRGVYPSEILPSQLQIHPGAQMTQLLSAEILAAVGDLKAGHSRIIRLCRCVSQVLKSRSM